MIAAAGPSSGAVRLLRWYHVGDQIAAPSGSVGKCLLILNRLGWNTHRALGGRIIAW